MYGFFWQHKPAGVNRPTLQLPPSKGGWSMPDVAVVTKFLALKLLLKTLDNAAAPAYYLAVYWCSTLLSYVVQNQPAGAQAIAERPHRHYAAIFSIFRKVKPLLGNVSLGSVPAGRVSELLAVTRTGAQRRIAANDFRFSKLADGWIPTGPRDIGWRIAWEILPTRDRLRRLGVLCPLTCNFCPHLETARHVIVTCRVAQAFWCRASRSLGFPCVPLASGSYRRPRTARARLSRLAAVIGQQILWNARTAAVLRNRRSLPVMLCVFRTRQELVRRLNELLIVLGEEAFTNAWCDPNAIRVHRGIVTLKRLPL